MTRTDVPAGPLAGQTLTLWTTGGAVPLRHGRRCSAARRTTTTTEHALGPGPTIDDLTWPDALHCDPTQDVNGIALDQYLAAARTAHRARAHVLTLIDGARHDPGAPLTATNLNLAGARDLLAAELYPPTRHHTPGTFTELDAHVHTSEQMLAAAARALRTFLGALDPLHLSATGLPDVLAAEACLADYDAREPGPAYAAFKDTGLRALDRAVLAAHTDAGTEPLSRHTTGGRRPEHGPIPWTAVNALRHLLAAGGQQGLPYHWLSAITSTGATEPDGQTLAGYLAGDSFSTFPSRTRVDRHTLLEHATTTAPILYAVMGAWRRHLHQVALDSSPVFAVTTSTGMPMSWHDLVLAAYPTAPEPTRAPVVTLVRPTQLLVTLVPTPALGAIDCERVLGPSTGDAARDQAVLAAVAAALLPREGGHDLAPALTRASDAFAQLT